MKTYHQHNFFKHTFCEFTQIDDFDFPENTNYKSKSDSLYYYTKEGVYRKSNHWGRVANCRWKLLANENYKNQQIVIGFASWSSFYPINSSEKNFFIAVNYKTKTAFIQPKEKNSSTFLFSFTEAQKRIKQITNLFADNKWANYFDDDIDVLRFNIISEFISTNKTIAEIKRNL